MNTNNNQFENETVEQDVAEFVENVKKDEGYTPDRKVFTQYVEWMYANPSGTYAEWFEYRKNNK